jgi:hypothetical protein
MVCTTQELFEWLFRASPENLQEIGLDRAAALSDGTQPRTQLLNVSRLVAEDPILISGSKPVFVASSRRRMVGRGTSGHGLWGSFSSRMFL